MWRPRDLDEAYAPLSRRERLGLIIEILGAYGRVRWLLRRGTLPMALSALRNGRSRPTAHSKAGPGGAEVVMGRRMGHAVTRTLRALPTDGRCLVRSLTLAALLESRGIDCEVVIGARPQSDFAAHAWVEVGDRVVLETDPTVFRPLWRG